MKEIKEEPKQETLQELAKKYYPPYPDGIITNEIIALREGFVKGCQVQSDRLYSEEDMKDFGKFCAEYDYRCFGSKTQDEMLSIWLEQYKKK
jgi:hypothetical protein